LIEHMSYERESFVENEMLHNAHLEGGSFFWEAGPTGVLLIHGFTATAAEVRLLARRLHERGYTVSAPLLPGHGTDPADLNRTRWREWTDAAEGAYDQLAARCQQVLVGGESMGAVVALYLASEHPEVMGVMAYAPALKLALSPVDVIRLTLAAPFVPFHPKGSLDADTRWQGYRVDPLRGAVQLLRLARRVRRRLSRIEQPVLVVQGRRDTTVDPCVGEMILKGVRSQVKELHWMEHSPHVVLLGDERDQVTDLTLSFIESAAQGAE